MKKYYDKPTQVCFQDLSGEDHRILGGIAYQDKIICGECGEILCIENYTDEELIIQDLCWVSISEEILGE